MTFDRNIYRMRTSILTSYVRSLTWLRWGWAFFALAAVMTVAYVSAKIGMGPISTSILGLVSAGVAVVPAWYTHGDLQKARKELDGR